MKKKAIVVGIDDYQKNPLKGAVSDAYDISQLLQVNGNETTNFEVKTYFNVPTRSELLTLLTNFFNVQADIGIFYFAGHGYVNELGGYIVTPDHKKYEEGVAMHDILNLANEAKIRNIVIILDCCKSGAIGSPALTSTITPINSGISILTACRDDEPAKEIDGRGVFTALLVEALKGGAADLRGHISPGGVYAYIDQALGAHEQRPVFKTNVTEFVALRSVIPQVPLSILRKIDKYFPEPTTNLKLDPSFEDTNTHKVVHEVIEPYADDNNVKIFKDLQQLESVGLVVPVGEEHMYFAAMRSKSCKLTGLGHHYWKLVREGII